ncbi:MAG: hypothetical protein Q8O41_01290 [Candidatus Methanoperedens sp.]|nr:hypothetical protein [Candidatus Methanoperedens sp.]
MTSITAKNAENAKITVTTNSKRTHNELRVRTSSYQFAVKMKLCELSAWYGKLLKPQIRPEFIADFAVGRCAGSG